MATVFYFPKRKEVRGIYLTTHLVVNWINVPFLLSSVFEWTPPVLGKTRTGSREQERKLLETANVNDSQAKMN